jgi:hypothetical protein
VIEAAKTAQEAGHDLPVGGGRCYNNHPRNRNSAGFSMRQVRVLVSLLIAAVGAAACTYDRGEGPPQIHFAEFRVAPPDGNSVEVCHAYTCQMKTDFYFRPKDIQDIAM